MKHILKFFQEVDAEAHCDIPCGIYDATPAKIAAKTVERMAMQIEELAVPDMGDAHAIKAFLGAVSRRTTVKENHAEICKRELQILWSDFFKSEHLEKYPNLHDLVWRALKLASKNKQETNPDSARELGVAVDEIAKIFYSVKNAPEKYDAYKKITDTLF